MTLDELKSTIEQKTGIPANLLQGTEPNEVIAYAKNLANFAKPAAPISDSQTKSVREIFSEWVESANGLGKPDPEPGTGAIQALNQIEADLARPYPNVQDGGEIPPTFNKPSTRDQFLEWARSALAYNPYGL